MVHNFWFKKESQCNISVTNLTKTLTSCQTFAQTSHTSTPTQSPTLRNSKFKFLRVHEDVATSYDLLFFDEGSLTKGAFPPELA